MARTRRIILKMRSFVRISARPLSLVALAACIACSSESSSTTDAVDGAVGQTPLGNGEGGANGASGAGSKLSGGTGGNTSGFGDGGATATNGGVGNANGGAGDSSGGSNGTSGGGGNASGGSGNGTGGVHTTGGTSGNTGGATGTGGKGTGGVTGTGGKGTGGVTGTGGTTGTGGATGTGGTTSTGGGKSAGCGVTGSKTGDYTSTIVVGTATRSFEVIVGSGYNTNTAVPLTFVYHGLGGDPSVSKAFGLQDAASRAGNVGIFVFPAGVSQGGGTGWDLGCGGTDTAFFDALSKQLENQYCIATDRIFGTGFSYGGDFANTLACCRGSTLRAVAVASGALYVGGCAAATPAFRLTSGTADPNYSQGEFTKGLTRAQTGNHCTTTLAPITPSPCQAYQGCDAGKPVVWCSYANMGHQLPDGWADATWAFFSSFQ